MAEGRPQRSVGQALTRLLREYGVDTVFGIPGVHNVELFRDIEQTGIRCILPRHEQGAGFMADGYARATGKPGVCFIISGPGLTNIMTPMGQAYSDSIPMLVISSVIERRYIAKGFGRLHEMPDQEGAAGTVSRWSDTADNAEELPDLIARAFAGFSAERPRPVHIQIPLDVLKGPAEGDWSARPMPSLRRPEVSSIATAADLLKAARKPVLLFGGGAVGAADAARAILDRLPAMAVTTVAGKGVIPEDHPRTLCATLPRMLIQDAVCQADVMLAVGTELSDTDFWRELPVLADKLIRIDVDTTALASRPRAELAIQGDARVSLEMLLEHLPEVHGEHGDIASACTALKAQASEHIDAERPGILPAIEAMRAAMPADAVVASDMTEIAYISNERFSTGYPRSWLHPVGFGTLGYALPAAIGAKFGRPDAPVATLIGDFGLHYTMPELGVAVEHGLSIPIILWNNEKLREIEQDMIRKQIAPVAIKARNPDFGALARAFGANATRPANLDAFKKDVADAFDADGPTLIELTPAAVAASS